MPSTQMRDRLLPSLLDRLTDEAPALRTEGRDARILTHAQLRASVLRNLSCLFNAVNHEASSSLEDYPQIRHSVLNFGLPSLSGRVASGIDLRDLEHELRQAVLNFEPRLIASSVQVTATGDARDNNSHNTITFRIDAHLWAQPAPLEMCLHTALDLESGQCSVAETGRRRT